MVFEGCGTLPLRVPLPAAAPPQAPELLDIAFDEELVHVGWRIPPAASRAHLACANLGAATCDVPVSDEATILLGYCAYNTVTRSTSLESTAVIPGELGQVR